MYSIVYHKVNTNIVKESEYNQLEISSRIQFYYSNDIVFRNNKYFITSKSLNINDDKQEKILEYFIKNEYEFPKGIDIDFSGVIINKKINEIFIVRDRYGVQPIYYYDSDSIFIVSDKIKFIKDYINVQDLEPEWLKSLFTGIIFNKDLTAIKEIKRLPPANFLKLNKDFIGIKKYWSLTFNGFNNLSVNDNIEQLHFLIKKSVEDRLDNTTASELSGGIDSSAIVGIAAKKYPQLKTFSHSLPDELQNKFLPFFDERRFFNKVLEYNNIENNHYSITGNNSGLFDTMHKELRIYGTPINKGISYLSNDLLQTAEQKGIRNMLSGFGGDEGASNMGVFQYYAWAKEFNIYKLLKYKRNPISAIKFAYKDFLNIESRLNTYLINDNYINEIQIGAVIKDYFNDFKFKNLTEFILYKLEENYIPNRLENMSQSAMERGITYSYPLLDYQLLEFYISIPDKYKFYKAKRRYLFKEATKNYIPSEVYLRNDKAGATMPNALHRFMIDYDKIYEFLQSSRNGQAFEYLDYDKMLKSLATIKNTYEKKLKKTNHHLFFNALMLVLYLEGEY